MTTDKDWSLQEPLKSSVLFVDLLSRNPYTYRATFEDYDIELVGVGSGPMEAVEDLVIKWKQSFLRGDLID